MILVVRRIKYLKLRGKLQRKKPRIDLGFFYVILN